MTTFGLLRFLHFSISLSVGVFPSLGFWGAGCCGYAVVTDDPFPNNTWPVLASRLVCCCDETVLPMMHRGSARLHSPRRTIRPNLPLPQNIGHAAAGLCSNVYRNLHTQAPCTMLLLGDLMVLKPVSRRRGNHP